MSRHTLLLRLAGPMQSWGVQSRFSRRETALEPTKSGVIGLVCAALGRAREASVSDLATLRFGVRVDREGTLRRDYHTAGRGGFIRARGAIEREDVVLSHRFYLADAWFTAGLEGGEEALPLLRAVDEALGRPRWPLSLGRKAFPPAAPVRILAAGGSPTGLVAQPLAEALLAFEDPYWREVLNREPPRPRRIVLEADAVDETALPGWQLTARPVRPDQPISFAPRRFALREVAVYHATEAAP
ncbi:MAG TPA: type I-E CRISPR-associated protein Cas5/CasD [Rubricoccaceae bacterium]|nr:type I-E CRISPR-associated protein Cas5/CasD [Rubricoccaceae bacterium]